MINVSEVGSSCDIQIQGKYPLFSDTQFDKFMIDDNYEKKLDVKNNNQPYYQKEDTIIFNNYNQNIITLRLFNTISIEKKYSDFTKLLANLSFKPEHTALLGGHFKTFITGEINPQVFLDNILNPKIKESVGLELDIKPGIISVVLANTDVTDVDLQIRMEPLASSPKEALYIEFIFRTTNYEAFHEFISKFGADFIKEIIGSISEINGTNS